ncbi:MAG: SHOCT domain-containing protein [Nocardioidaceae bacterium]
MIRRLLATVVVCLAFLALGSTAASAAGGPNNPPAKCFRANSDGVPATCTYDNGVWTSSYDDGFGGGSGSGVPAGFAAFAVLVVIGGIALTVWKVSMARTMARRSGMDPGQATAVTLLSDDGLDATYLAANLRGSQPTHAAAAPAPRTAQDRLRELQDLRNQGLVTPEEYEARRTAIVESI